MNKTKVDLGPVQETLLVPLLGRALETGKRRGLLCDPKAVEIVDRLDYDFDRWRGARSLVGACLRTRMFDEDVRDFLDMHPEGTVVEIGCGLNTRFERIDNGRARWFELDLPDSMALRRRFFEDGPRRTMLEASVLDTDWHDVVAETGGPWCFVSEAVIIYLEESDVERALRGLAERFEGAWLVTDTTSSKMVDAQKNHDVMKTMSSSSWFRWKCDDPAALRAWGLRSLRSRTFLDAPASLRSAMPLFYRLLMIYAPWLMRRQVDGYRINRFELAGAA
ncbi:MAG: class I SAM-dependent methyltransferase [Myxococcota bacterium]